MKIDFLFAWTKNRDRQDEYMKSVGGNLSLPKILGNLFFFLRKKK